MTRREAARWPGILGFVKKADVRQGPFRWLTVASPEEPDGAELQLALNDTRGNIIQLTQLPRAGRHGR